MAWSPQARAAALAARRRKHHGSASKHIHAKYTVTAKQAGKHKGFKAKAKKAAKYTAIAGAAGAGGAALAVGAYGAYTHAPTKANRSAKIRRDARSRVAMKGGHASAIRTQRKFAKKYGPGHPNTLAAQHNADVSRASLKQINRYKKRTPAGKTRKGKQRYR